MTNEEAVRWLSVIRADLTGLKRCSPKESEALDHAIAVLERPAASGKAIDHSGDSTNMVTPFDGRVAFVCKLTKENFGDIVVTGEVWNLLDDMQAHIRSLKEEKRSNDEQWRLQLANLRLQIYKLEQDLKAAFYAGAAWATCNHKNMKPIHPNFAGWIASRQKQRKQDEEEDEY